MNDNEMVGCKEPAMQMERLRNIMHRLRAPGGCAWDAKQTHSSLLSNLVEEAYETVDTIKRGDMNHMREELGDLLLQIVFHCEIAEQNGDFDFNDVAATISEKLIRRHPHVFAETKDLDVDDVLNQWELIKQKEKGSQKSDYLNGVGDGLPGLLKAAKLQRKASKVGFDWPDARSIINKIYEELDEVQEELTKHENTDFKSDALEAEIGDLLFVVVNFARKLKIDPEIAIDRTNQKFINRFSSVEANLKKRGLELDRSNLSVMEHEWLRAKAAEK